MAAQIKPPFILTTVQNGIRKIILNRPEKKNAISPQMYKELKTILNDSSENNDIHVVIVTGTGSFFTSGNDISHIFTESNITPETIENVFKTFHDFVEALIRCRKLLVAIVNGPAIGIGSTMLGLFDIVYASEKAYFQTPFSNLGLVAEGCSTYTFPRIMGNSKAGNMLYLGCKMSAMEANQCGLVSEVYKPDDIQKVWDYLNKISSLSTESILATKCLMKRWQKDTLLEVNAEEIKALVKRWESPDLIQRFMAFSMRKSNL